MKPDPRDGLLGLAVADAIGVPVEFQPRSALDASPVIDIRGYGTYNQPPGTWSDDSSLTFCLADSLCHGFDLQDQADRFVRWLYQAEWTPHGHVFDNGIATAEALYRLKAGASPTTAGGRDEMSNGNGSLMRILPLAYTLLDHEDPLPLVHDASRLTHGHPRSLMACGFYIWMARLLLKGVSSEQAYLQTCEVFPSLYQESPFVEELPHFERSLSGGLAQLARDEIRSSGYVMHTLEAALWCLLRTSTYKECVLLAVNLGEDTDTTAAVVGGLAGIVYGWEAIPEHWLEALARREDIETLCKRLGGVRGGA